VLLNRIAPLLGMLLLSSAAQAQDSQPDDASAASQGAAGTGSVKYQIGFYNHSDSGAGNPFLDETLTVIEPVIILDHNVSDRFGYGLKFSFDSVSSASIDRLSEFEDQ
jgi:opacity protein-like surface antigen